MMQLLRKKKSNHALDIKENQQWMDWPDHLIIFINPEDSNEYSYYGRYEWKNNQWRLQH